MENLRLVDWIEFLMMWFAHYVIEGGGDSFFLTDPEITAIPWSIISPILVISQILFLLFINKFYANGNTLLISMQTFTII